MLQALRLAVKDIDRVEPCHDQMFHGLIFGEITFERMVYSRGRMHRADDLHTERQPLSIEYGPPWFEYGVGLDHNNTNQL
jgi:hypothetical protein